MREYTVPAARQIPTDAHLAQAVWRHAEATPRRVTFSRRDGNRWVDVTARQFADQVEQVAAGLVRSGIGSGDRVGLMSRTRYEWTVLDYAIWSAGAVSVPIYETSAADQISWILGDSSAVAVLVETSEHLATISELRNDLPALTHVWTIEKDALDEIGRSADQESRNIAEQRRSALRSDTLATLIYTSGTTGRPKGCELTHGNMLAEIYGAAPGFPTLLTDAATLLFLPLAHVLARAVQCIGVELAIRLGHSSDITDLLADFAGFKPTFILAVPRVLEKVHTGAGQRARAAGRGAIFDRAEKVAVQTSERHHPGLLLRLQHAVFDKLVYRKLRAALGGHCVAACSGGAPLGPYLGHFFRGIGLTVYEGYGLTESTAVSTVNSERSLRVGTVGRPISGLSVRIANDGEILLRGPSIFAGYRGDPDGDSGPDPEGWFATGDLGELDDDGYLTVTGRKKEMIVTAGGKNVVPSTLEDTVRRHPLVSQCMVVGDRRPFIAALITVDVNVLPGWLAERGRSRDTPLAELTGDETFLADLQHAVDDANRAVSKAESIRKIRVLIDDFTEVGGELTPTMKVKRSVVAQRRSEDIDALYRR